MRIIKSYASIIGPELLKTALRQVEWAARISHRSEDAQSHDADTTGKTNKFINAVVLQHGDWSVVEHVTVSVDMVVDRGITHELVRHRLFSFTQESTRFVNYEKKMPPSFIYPQVGVSCGYCLGGDSPSVSMAPMHYFSKDGVTSGHPCAYDPDWIHAIDTAERRYKDLLAKKWRPQEARSVFPNALASRIVVTGNLRNWRHFFLMRTTAEAHPQMREVTIPLLAEFQALIPVLYEDITPGARQVENIAKGR